MTTASAATPATGPRTAEGKAISSQNAIKHGLTSKSYLLPSEDPAEFEAYYLQQLRNWGAEGADFVAAVREYTEVSWRLDRVARYESRLIAVELASMQLERAKDAQLDRLLSQVEGYEDPMAVEALAMQRLFRTGALTNLHRQERQLYNRRLKLQVLLVSFHKLTEQRHNIQKRQEQLLREAAAREEARLKARARKLERDAAPSGVVQNELPATSENCVQMPLRA